MHMKYPFWNPNARLSTRMYWIHQNLDNIYCLYILVHNSVPWYRATRRKRIKKAKMTMQMKKWNQIPHRLVYQVPIC